MFEERLRRGQFWVTECTSCRHTVWPVSASCPRCLGKAVLRPYGKAGVVLEISSRRDVTFCVCRLGDDLTLMGRMVSPDCGVGARVAMSRCGMDGGVPFFEFSTLDGPGDQA